MPIQSAYETEEKTKIVFYSKKQQERYEKAVKTRGEDFTRSVRQLNCGDIVLHHFFQDEGRWLGYVELIGPRGGTKTLHNWTVCGNKPENLMLLR